MIRNSLFLSFQSIFQPILFAVSNIFFSVEENGGKERKKEKLVHSRTKKMDGDARFPSASERDEDPMAAAPISRISPIPASEFTLRGRCIHR